MMKKKRNFGRGRDRCCRQIISHDLFAIVTSQDIRSSIVLMPTACPMQLSDDVSGYCTT